jgi:hypothetical protein
MFQSLFFASHVRRGLLEWVQEQSTILDDNEAADFKILEENS